MTTGCKEIDEYISIVKSKVRPFCKEQKLLVKFVETVFKKEKLVVNQKQLDEYMSYQKYFPFELLPWEKFCFALHNCVYRESGSLRFPQLDIIVGRGSGKNGYDGFENFSLLTDTNNVDRYDIYSFATSEDQAKTSWEDVYDVLEKNRDKMKKHFKWNKEIIINTDTNSSYYYCTASPKTKDGQRPGKITLDEIHAYTDYKLINVAKTGLGKKLYPRQTIITTNGEVRGGPFDDRLEQDIRILNFEEPDNGRIAFICRLDSKKEVHHKDMWHKAIPSLYALPTLFEELEMEYSDYLANPAQNISFMSKRMNLPPEEMENAVTSWENILATNQDIDEDVIYGFPCVGGIDYMKTNDFLGAGLLFRVKNKDYWICHTWICSQSADLQRIKAPLQEWAARGLVTFVDAAEIPPELPAVWLANEAAKRNSRILKIAIDNYRYQLLSKALRMINFSADKGYENVERLRPSDEMLNIPSITSGFVNKRFCWGDHPEMRWSCNNAKTIVSSAGNITYGKIEPKSRKTDTFKAFVAAECISGCLDIYNNMQDTRVNLGVHSY